MKKACKYCGLDVIAVRGANGMRPSWAKRRSYCSDACKDKNIWIWRPCDWCGTHYKIRISRLNLGLHGDRFCHKDCYKECRFVLRIEISESVHPKMGSRCWIWTGAKTSAGYGHLHFKSKAIYAHRLSWQLKNGEIPNLDEADGYYGTCILHLCDNPSCVNPDHLTPGTMMDNLVDRDLKGRGKVAGISDVYSTGELDGRLSVYSEQQDEE